MAYDADQMRHWLDSMQSESETSEAHRKIHAGASLFLKSLIELPEGQYRDMALCKLTDAVALAYVAARP